MSDKHLKSTEEFANYITSDNTEGRLMSLDVENLFTSIPVDHVIRFLRDQSHGWGPSPPQDHNMPESPTYHFGMNSELFCDLVALCL